MKIGVDLDHTVYGFPWFFAQFISAMNEAGHSIYCTSNHLRREWPNDEIRLMNIGIDPVIISPELMCDDREYLRKNGAKNKARMADALDLVFDDHADHFQKLTDTPIFKVPIEKSKEKQLESRLRNIPLL